MAKVFKLPECYHSKGKGGGVIQGTASEATLTALLAAKSKALKEKNDFEKLIVYCSDQAHSSIKKACMIAGIPDKQIRMIEGDENFEMDPKTLEKLIEVEKNIETKNLG